MPSKALAAPVVTTEIPTISAEERLFEEKQVKRVKKGFETMVDAIFQIHSYKGGIIFISRGMTFEAYMMATFSFRKQHSYRLKKCGEFLHQIKLANPQREEPLPLPLNEFQYREIGHLPNEHQLPAWEVLTSRQPDVSSITQADAKEIVQEYKSKHNIIEEPKRTSKKKTPKEQVMAKLKKIKKAPQDQKFAREAALETLKQLAEYVSVLTKGRKGLDHHIGGLRTILNRAG